LLRKATQPKYGPAAVLEIDSAIFGEMQVNDPFPGASSSGHSDNDVHV
jgi:hypothetical protein